MSRCDGILEFFLINFLRMISLVRVQETVSSNSRARGGGGGDSVYERGGDACTSEIFN